MRTVLVYALSSCLIWLSVLSASPALAAAPRPDASELVRLAAPSVGSAGLRALSLVALHQPELGASWTLTPRQMDRFQLATDRDTQAQIDAQMGTARDLAEDLVRARIKLRKAKAAVGWGAAGLILGPLTLIAGVVFLVSLIGFLLGIVLLIAGAVWTAFSLPVLIIGLVARGANKGRVIELEERLNLKSWERPLEEKVFARLELRF